MLRVKWFFSVSVSVRQCRSETHLKCWNYTWGLSEHCGQRQGHVTRDDPFPWQHWQDTALILRSKYTSLSHTHTQTHTHTHTLTHTLSHTHTLSLSLSHTHTHTHTLSHTHTHTHSLTHTHTHTHSCFNYLCFTFCLWHFGLNFRTCAGHISHQDQNNEVMDYI